jgi:hypothetical protein
MLIESSSSMGAYVIQKTFWYESVVNFLSVIQTMFKKFLVLYRNAQANIRGISKQKNISKSLAFSNFMVYFEITHFLERGDLFRNNRFISKQLSYFKMKVILK